MLNKIVLQGRLTSDPDYSTSQSGTAFARFTIAVEKNFKDKQTGKYEADFISCNAYGHSADFIKQYFAKGHPITVEGSLRNNNYTDRNGVKHYSDVVAVDRAYFNIGGNNQLPQTQQSPQQAAQAAVQKADVNNIDMGRLEEYDSIISDGDVPF